MTADASTSLGFRLAGVTKSYGHHRIVYGLNLDVAAGEFVTMLGPSGSGKTTVLKIIAGFENPDCGEVFLGDRNMRSVPPERRNIGVVFQNYSLFPHMTVAANVGFPLRMRGVPKHQRTEAVRLALELVALPEYESRMPHQLSGGQQQRVAIARAIIFQPSLLLMDEPLGALDRRLRAEVQLEIKTLHERLGVTILYVTHDQDEALSMSDRIVVFNKGRIEQIGDPREVYRRPKTLFVADFLGDSLCVSATVIGHRARLGNSDVNVVLAQNRSPEGNVRLVWRSDQVSIGAPPAEVSQVGERVLVPAVVLTAAYSGAGVRLRVRLETGDVGIVAVDGASELSSGSRIGVILDLATATFLPVE